MKKTLLFVAIVIAMQMKTQAQSTAVPNADFEQFLITYTTIDGPLDGYILDSEAASVTGTLNLGGTAPYNAIDDFTGIEALTGITGLVITYNSAVTSLDVSANTSLTLLNTEGSTSLSNIVTGTNATLSEFRIPGSPVGTVDLSGNPSITIVDVRQTSLTSLDMRNGNNANVTSFDSRFNGSLECIFVDDKDATYLTSWLKDSGVFVNDEAGCSTLSVANETEFTFNIYPNPAKNSIYVMSSLQESKIQVYDITGKLVLKEQMQFGENTIDVSAMAPGVYLARILADGKSQTKKILIQ
ncbi:T9SS type A sorting domain-containing protein [Lacinutrix sp. C3R15]|uniref:T9SS type A sorting domain-containing protein n=1 Tax=Flavobacteriaceae TaxID=49546 RepID=UPI001C0839D2|nr:MULTISPECIES: T9SS type A sorting domain-containing protein [Flavobacteriaceae]MBU2939043.1 T9SS type A sorting domain-containing protein [Lacinutrix sp. C3R15]MDO6622358.1 T9SS type A sorting domain-containing protein [Oceanihabitans sp. 1_MG-2023]